MSWETITPKRGKSMEPGAPVMLGMSKGSASIRPRLYLSVAESALAALGWKEVIKLVVMRGTGEHAGKLRVAPGARGFTFRKQAAKVTRIRAEWSVWSDLVVAAHLDAVEWRKVAEPAGCIEIDLPEWAQPQKPVQRGFTDHPKALPAQPVAKRIA